MTELPCKTTAACGFVAASFRLQRRDSPAWGRSMTTTKSSTYRWGTRRYTASRSVFKCDMLKAIELGLITDNRLHVVCVKGDEDNLKKLAASKEVEDVEGTPFDVALACALKQVLGELGKAFAFHTFIRESRKTADILRAVLPKSARVEYVDSKRSNKENKEALDNFGEA